MRFAKISDSTTFNDDIECIVENMFLEDNEFVTISYVWGDVTHTRPIIVNGQTLEVIEVALRHFRDSILQGEEKSGLENTSHPSL